MGGHLFIVHGDLTALACDSWLMPCDSVRNVMPHWYVSTMGHGWTPPKPDDVWLSSRRQVERLTNWAPKRPQPWLVNTGGHDETDLSWYSDGVSEFVRAAAPFARSSPFLKGRAKPLLAIPLVGGGAGGGALRAGQLVTAMLPCLATCARGEDIDIALVLYDECSYTAAVQARSRTDHWSELSPELQHKASELAEMALQGRLVLFLGAGLGQAANLPGWRGLLQDLAAKIGISHGDAAWQQSFGELQFADQARLIELQLQRANQDASAQNGVTPQARTIGSEVSQILSVYNSVSIAHALLSSLPINEIVTTNYDQLFETAAKSIQRCVAVLPYERPNVTGRWLLKMHGCVGHPEDIVLTRGDYLRYGDQRAALRGIVQAMLITKHMLFVGFSLEDDNFQHIAEDVRKAIRGKQNTGGSPFGTVLTIDDNPLFRNLWSNDLSWVTFQAENTGKEPSKHAAAARQLEFFLDYLAAHTARPSRHLLEDRFDGVLSDGERQLRDAIRKFLHTTPAPARSTAAWKEIENALVQLGYRR